MVGIVLLILALFYSVIISIVFGFVLTVAIMGFAKIGSVKEGLAFFKVFDDIKQFGVLKLVGTYIMLGIVVGLGNAYYVIFKINSVFLAG